GACRLAVYKTDPLDDVGIAAGIERLTDAHVRVINLSVVLAAASHGIVDALNYASAAGVLVVAASGNKGVGTLDFPASALPAGGLAVGGSDAKGQRASFSNWGNQLSLLAPSSFDRRCAAGVIGALPKVAPAFEGNHSCDAI